MLKRGCGGALVPAPHRQFPAFWPSRHLHLSVRTQTQTQTQGKGRLWLVPPPTEANGAPQTIVPMPRFLAPDDRPDAPDPSHRYLGPLMNPANTAARPAAAAPDYASWLRRLAPSTTATKADDAAAVNLFKQWDTDGDGQVSREEFGKAMQATTLHRLTAHPLHTHFA